MRFNDKELRQYIKSVHVELEGNLTYFDFKDGKFEGNLFPTLTYLVQRLAFTGLVIANSYYLLS